MRYRRILVLTYPILLLTTFCFTACSDDDDGGNPPGDTVAPTVTSMNPEDETGVALGATVTIGFSEAMDQATADGNITVSAGDITGIVWPDDRTLSLAHTDWPEATEITVTVTTGLKDAAGNSLAAARTASFWTFSSTPVVLESEPENGATGVLLSYSPRLHFSQRMNLASLIANTDVNEGLPRKSVPDFSIYEQEDGWYLIDFDGDLDPSTVYTIVVGSDTQVEGGSETLGETVYIQFTTGTETDETPPEIVSVTPAIGSTANPDQGTIVIQFSEPILHEDLQPSRIAAQLMTSMAGEPDWNAERDRVTVYLRTPLPGGVRLFAVFGPGSFHDGSGNGNTAEDSVSFKVSGSPDFYPLHTDWTWYYYEYGEEDDPSKSPYESEFRRTVVDVSGQTFTRLTERGDAWSSAWTLDDREYMRKNADALWFRGFEESEGNATFDVMFSPEVRYQDLPFLAGGTWSGTSTFSMGVDTGTVTYSGRTVGRETIVIREMSGKVSDPPRYYFEDCWKAIIQYETGAGETVFDAGNDTIWYAPGIGSVREYSGGYEVVDGVAVNYWSRSQLHEIEIEGGS